MLATFERRLNNKNKKIHVTYLNPTVVHQNAQFSQINGVQFLNEIVVPLFQSNLKWLYISN